MKYEHLNTTLFWTDCLVSHLNSMASAFQVQYQKGSPVWSPSFLCFLKHTLFVCLGKHTNHVHALCVSSDNSQNRRRNTESMKMIHGEKKKLTVPWSPSLFSHLNLEVSAFSTHSLSIRVPWADVSGIISA